MDEGLPAIFATLIIIAAATIVAVMPVSLSSPINISQIQEIAARHHTLSGECMNSTTFLWTDLEAAGFSTRIMAGNLSWTGHGTIPQQDINHVWVQVEARPGEWTSIESLTGTLIPVEMTSYYSGIVLDNPQQMWDLYYSLEQ